ncbi:MAG: NAD(P)/FAD-dependent oxidoreductase, partial [Salinibacterium amurskyense]
MENTSWDVVVVGGGPAGLSAALLLGRARRRTLVIDAGEPRNRFASHMHGVLGNEGVSPRDLSASGRREAAAYGVETIEGRVDRVDEIDGGLTIALSDGSEISTRALIVATGITDVLPDIPGLSAHWGTGVLHCPYCHGWEVGDQRLGVLATSPAALHQAHLVRQWSDDVTVFTAGLGELDDATAARLRTRGVTLIDSPAVEVLGTPGELSGVRTADGATVVLDAVFSAGAPRPHDEFIAHLSLARTEIIGSSFIEVDFAGATSNTRIWAVGNVVNPMLTVPMSIGAGAMTGAAVNGALVTEDFDIAEKLATPEGFWQARYSGEGRVWSG